jgi:ferredoxin
MSSAIRVTVALSRCEGHGRCVTLAPQVFGYNDVTSQSYVIDDAALDSNRALIVRAAADCPECAITVVEGDNRSDKGEG